jgi:hypothetical protein
MISCGRLVDPRPCRDEQIQRHHLTYQLEQEGPRRTMGTWWGDCIIAPYSHAPRTKWENKHLSKTSMRRTSSINVGCWKFARNGPQNESPTPIWSLVPDASPKRHGVAVYVRPPVIHRTNSKTVRFRKNTTGHMHRMHALLLLANRRGLAFAGLCHVHKVTLAEFATCTTSHLAS